MNKIKRYIDVLFDTLIEMALITFICAGVSLGVMFFYNIANIYGLIVLSVIFIIRYIWNLKDAYYSKEDEPGGFSDYGQYESDGT